MKKIIKYVIIDILRNNFFRTFLCYRGRRFRRWRLQLLRSAFGLNHSRSFIHNTQVQKYTGITERREGRLEKNVKEEQHEQAVKRNSDPQTVQLRIPFTPHVLEIESGVHIHFVLEEII